MVFLYGLATRVVLFVLPLAALFSTKLKSGLSGRQDWRKKYASQFSPQGPILWVHVASLGEYEQGRPVMEGFKQRFPDWKLVVTFFSPSGYEMRKADPLADFVAYLPFDTSTNAKDWVNWLRPSMVVFVKYEIWPCFLKEVSRQGIPLYLIAALFRKEQVFFRWYGAYFRNALARFTTIFVQTKQSADLLSGIGFTNLEVTGDTRVDRVLEIAERALPDPIVERFSAGDWTIIAGSTWEPDEIRLMDAIKTADLGLTRVVCAPHAISAANLNRLELQLGGQAIRYSNAGELSAPALKAYTWLIVDNIGKLNVLYRYGSIAYIGGGFGVGIHNTLEPAAWGLPVLFGPKYQKFEEAKQLISRGAAFSISTAAELAACLQRLKSEQETKKASEEVLKYLQESKGATEKIIDRLEQQILGQ